MKGKAQIKGRDTGGGLSLREVKRCWPFEITSGTFSEIGRLGFTYVHRHTKYVRFFNTLCGERLSDYLDSNRFAMVKLLESGEVIEITVGKE